MTLGDSDRREAPEPPARAIALLGLLSRSWQVALRQGGDVVRCVPAAVARRRSFNGGAQRP